MAMRVIVLGAGGILGRCLVDAFRGDEVIAWTRQDVDLTDTASLRARVERVAPECIVNAAAYTAVDRAESEPDAADAVNGRAVEALADAAAAIGATFVHFSTEYVFDGTDPGGYAEDAPPNPVNAYGRSKLLGEQGIARVAASAGSGWRWHCIRTSRLFGSTGASPGSKRSFVDAIRARARDDARIEVIDAEVSSPTCAVDLAAATAALLRSGAPSGISHRTNDGACTWFAFAAAVLGGIGWNGELVPVPLDRFPRLARRPAHAVLRTTKLPPLRRWEDALREYLRDDDEDEN